MKKPRRHRLSIFPAAASLASRPIKHHSCKSAERASALFKDYSTKAQAKGWRVIWHRGNLKHHSYVIEEDSSNPRPQCGGPVIEPTRVDTPTRLDELAAKHTAFADFAELVGAPGYRPSLNVAVPEVAELADAYDAAFAGVRSAHRFSFVKA